MTAPDQRLHYPGGMTFQTVEEGDREWFLTLFDTATDVYFRYALGPARGFVYLSPSVHTLTGHAPEAFYTDPALCFGLTAREDRRLLRQVLRSRRALHLTLRVHRGATVVPVDLRTIAVVRRQRIVAIEGMARIVLGSERLQPQTEEGRRDAAVGVVTGERLADLISEVHELLHRFSPASTAPSRPCSANRVAIGGLVLNLERLTVAEDGQPVSLTSRELLVLRHLLLRPGRVITRAQLLSEVWGYSYTGDDRTVDVHISRLRRKLPSFRSRLVAVRHVGYRLDVDDDERGRISNS